MNARPPDKTVNDAVKTGDGLSEPEMQARGQAAVKDKLDELYSRAPWDPSAMGEAEIAILRKFGIS